MSRLPQVTPRQMLAALGQAGFETRRIKGSHHYLVHKDVPEPTKASATEFLHYV